MNVTVLGIDPGTGITGYGVVRRNGSSALSAPQLVECGIIRTNVRDALPVRLAEIYESVTEIIARHKPQVLAIEDVFYGRNVRTAVVLGHARGVIMLAGERAGLEIHEFSPATIKKSVVGAGAASKEQVQFMVMRLLRLKTVPKPADAADGVAAALTYCLSPTLVA